MSRTFVLVPGACHGGWAWQAVANHLRSAGHTVHAYTPPGLGADDDRRGVGLDDVARDLVAYVKERDLHDVSLVGHSWGGMVLSAVAHDLEPRLAHLVYYGAFVPLAGESLRDLCPPHYQELFDSLAGASDDNSLTFPLPVLQGGFIQDASEDVQLLAHSLLTPQPYATMTDPVGRIDYAALDVAQSYVVSPDDLALPPGEFGWTPRFPERLHRPTVVTSEGSHEAMFTRPDVVARDLLAAVGA